MAEITGERLLSEIFGAEANELARESRAELEHDLDTSLAAVRLDGSDEIQRLSAATLLRKLQRHEDIIPLLADGVSGWPSRSLWHRYIDILAECNRTAEAIASASEARIAFPSDLLFEVKEALLLPVLYDSPAEIDRYRERFAAGLRRLSAEIVLDTAEDRRQALAALSNYSIFLLSYAGRNDRDLLTEYGNLAHRIMAASYPRWVQPLRMPPTARGQLRIGYVSERFRDLSAVRFFLGWMRGHDPARFAIYAWHTGTRTDRATDEVRRICTSFHHFPETRPGALEEICQSIRSYDLHALVFLDAGMEPLVTQLAALRLAPLQCKAWDQPVTSGLPTIDCVFSPALSEPEWGEEHYSERLIRLPGVGVCYQKPLIPMPLLRKTRRDFGLSEEAVVYLCCQQIFKFLPENDEVFASIARRVPEAQFVFTVMNKPVQSDFVRRLDRAFAAAGLRAEDHCVMLTELEHLDYWNLHFVGDVFLDTIGWSSGGSVFEAIACRTPVVTLEGEFMRGRQGSGILRQLGVTATIARDRAGYVEIAVRLGWDRRFREEIRERIAAGHSRLYSDPSSVAALDEFFAGEIVTREG